MCLFFDQAISLPAQKTILDLSKVVRLNLAKQAMLYAIGLHVTEKLFSYSAQLYVHVILSAGLCPAHVQFM